VQSLVERSGINARERESLAEADALRPLSQDRYRAFWDVAGYEEKLPLFEAGQDWPEAEQLAYYAAQALGGAEHHGRL